MDSDLQMQPQANADSKTTFRKPLSDAANRKYRRRSPVGGSSSSDGSPKHDHKGSPSSLGEDPAKVLENRPRIKDDVRELDKDSGRSRYGRAAYSHRHSDRLSSRSSHGYSKHDDNIRHDKREDDGEKDNYRLISHTGRESRGSTRSDYRRQDSEYGRSRDSGGRYPRDRYDSSGYRYKEKDPSYEKQKYKDKDSSADRTSSGRRHSGSNSEEREQHRRDGRDEKRDYYRRSGDYKSDRAFPYDESQEHGVERDRFKEGRKEIESRNLVKEERRTRDDREANSDKDGHDRASGEKGENRFTFATENRESSAKRPKLFSPDKATDNDKDATVAAMESSSSKQAREIDSETQRQARPNVAEATTDLDAAKFAAMKAAESVNRNLVGLGVLSTDQKKKLLWGSKKNTNAEESAHCWDAPLFGDRERQEKFNKLMGVKGDFKVEHKPDNQEGGGLLQAEKQKELQLDLEKQYTAGLRRRDGRTVGLGL